MAYVLFNCVIYTSDFALALPFALYDQIHELSRTLHYIPQTNMAPVGVKDS